MIVRVILPLCVAFFAWAALVRPMLRMRRETGRTGIALGGVRGLGRLIEVGLGVFLVSAATWAVLVAAAGPDALGVVRAPVGLVALGVALMLAGVLLVVVAQVQMGRSWRIGIDTQPTGLVDRGLFALVRNPIYDGMMVAVAGAVAVTPCVPVGVAAVLAAVFISMQARLEERHLTQAHGEAYRAYASRVGRFVPGIGRLAR